MNPPESFPSVPREAQELISDISQLMAEAEEMLSNSTSHHAEEKVALLAPHHAQPSPERVLAQYRSLKERFSRLARRTDEAIRACPYESLAVALGVGVVVGAALCCRARSSD